MEEGRDPLSTLGIMARDRGDATRDDLISQFVSDRRDTMIHPIITLRVTWDDPFEVFESVEMIWVSYRFSRESESWVGTILEGEMESGMRRCEARFSYGLYVSIRLSYQGESLF